MMFLRIHIYNIYRWNHHHKTITREVYREESGFMKNNLQTQTNGIEKSRVHVPDDNQVAYPKNGEIVVFKDLEIQKII